MLLSIIFRIAKDNENPPEKYITAVNLPKAGPSQTLYEEGPKCTKDTSSNDLKRFQYTHAAQTKP